MKTLFSRCYLGVRHLDILLPFAALRLGVLRLKAAWILGVCKPFALGKSGSLDRIQKELKIAIRHLLIRGSTLGFLALR
ncbi:hypothetical protein SCLCIDRAFT_1208639 [Scleroderma citrinum Foug A]|uniref:Uncharacterized protein n=1 Tax=Scleroderma citrinum Foug A TaxID=1036808 RepID=A0A0C3E901_9AGAM|nr:hypothetical protein SCLCIDRAFT_1208639 [Scleroderma citrinum Foug A]